jgi:hypothetical protein
MNRIANLHQITDAIDRLDLYFLQGMRHSLITAVWDANGDHHFLPTRLGEHYIRQGRMQEKLEHAASGASEDLNGEPRPIPAYDHFAQASPTFLRELSRN